MEKIIIKIELADGNFVEPRNLYQYSNRVLMDSYKKALEDDRDDNAKALLKQILSRFESDSCTKAGESKDELFARTFSDYVNRCPNDFKVAAKKMACEHRYLQNEMFKVFMEYVKILASNEAKGCYDPRNQYACKASAEIIKHFKDSNFPYWE